jgi:16S rRNA (uracil1498-N3)-methyltransferase
MSAQQKSIARLFVDQHLKSAATVSLTQDQSHYISNVLRGEPGQHVRLFNGKDGEWSGTISQKTKREVTLQVTAKLREQQPPGAEVVYAFALLKRARLDYVVQKATELGVSALQPLITEHTHIERLNMDRMRANVVEAAEQCELLHLPQVSEAISLDAALSKSFSDRQIIFCDEAAPITNPIEALKAARDRNAAPSIAVLIGPEGGFSDKERAKLLALPNVTRLSMGPRIMRADTAAVASLALVMATLGDWR